MVVIFLLSLVIAAGLALIPANIAKNKGYSFGLWWFYGWMIWIAAIIHVQFIPDRNKPQTTYMSSNTSQIPPARTNTQTGANELKMYKELLDSGAISQEEFDAKKKQILNL